MKWKRSLFCCGLLILLLMIIFYPVEAQTGLFSVNTIWVVPPSDRNITVRLGRFFDFDYLLLQNGRFYASYNGTEYYFLVTSGWPNIRFTLYNWFDRFGTYFQVNQTCSINFYTPGKGEPSRVNGALYTWNNVTEILTVTVASAGLVGIHYNTGATVYVSNADRTGFYHSQDSPRGYRTAYGYGITRTGYYQYGFQTRTYCNYTESDIQTIRIALGNSGVVFTYNHNTHRISHSDPNGYCEIASEWYGQNALGSWVNYDSETRYLDVGFNIYFKWISGNQSIPQYWFPRYQPYLEQQNATVTVNSATEGNRPNTLPAIFYIGLARLPFPEPVYIPWNLQFLVIGLGGMFTLIFSMVYGVWKIKHGQIPEGIAYGLMIGLIGLGLIMIWLWR